MGIDRQVDRHVQTSIWFSNTFYLSFSLSLSLYASFSFCVFSVRSPFFVCYSPHSPSNFFFTLVLVFRFSVSFFNLTFTFKQFFSLSPPPLSFFLTLHCSLALFVTSRRQKRNLFSLFLPPSSLSPLLSLPLLSSILFFFKDIRKK